MKIEAHCTTAECRVTESTSRRKLVLWVCLGISVLGCAFCYTGFVMAGSFTGSNPEQIEHWRRVAHVYLVLTGICAIAALAIIVALYHRGERVQPTARRF
jgi:hypothetical protein